RFFQSFFEAFVHFEDFAVDVVVADADAHGVCGDGHAFDHDMRVETQDVAVFEGAGFAFVGVAYQVLLPWKGTRHEAPFEAGGKARAAAATKAGRLDFGDDVFRLHAGRQ